MFTYEQRLDMVVTNAWEIITNNGIDMDEEEKEHYTKACYDAASKAYLEGITNDEWLKETLAKLGYEKE